MDNGTVPSVPDRPATFIDTSMGMFTAPTVAHAEPSPAQLAHGHGSLDNDSGFGNNKQ